MKNKIKEFREERKMTQNQLSEKSGVSRSIISGLESGRTKTTTTDTLYRIAVALDVQINELFSTQSA